MAFRMYESSKLRRKGDAAPSKLKNHVEGHAASSRQAQQLQDDNEQHENFAGGRYYCDRHGQWRMRDFDGFDNVVLSVTVYATSSDELNTKKADSTIQISRPTSGNVVVMELLSTKDPPDLDSHDIRAGKVKKISSSSSSHTNPPPPPAPPASKCGSSGGESDSSAVSSTSNTPQQQQLEDDEDDTLSNHTRVLARRVLRWPSSLRSLDLSNQSRPTMYNHKLYSNCHGCPSHVSLGRTTVWEERSPKETQQSVDVKPKTGLQTLANSNVAKESLEQEIFTTSRCSFNQEDRAADALEAIRSLDFLFGAGNSAQTSSKTKPSSAKSKKADETPAHNDSNNTGKRMKMTRPLCLCFITNDGSVHFFHAMRVFLSRGSTSKRRTVYQVVLQRFSLVMACLQKFVTTSCL